MCVRVHVPDVGLLTSVIFEVEPTMHNYLEYLVQVSALYNQSNVQTALSFYPTEKEWTDSHMRIGTLCFNLRVAKILYRYHDRVKESMI